MPRFLDRAEVREHIADGAQLVEVLEPSQYDETHLPSAVNIPLWELDERAPKELDTRRPVVVYCYDYQ